MHPTSTDSVPLSSPWRKHDILYDIILLIHTKVRPPIFHKICKAVNVGGRGNGEQYAIMVASYTTTSCCCLKAFCFALLWLIGVFLICTESTDNNEFPGFDWLWSLIITLPSRLGACFEWVSDQRMQILVRRWRQFPPKFDFNIHLRVKSFLMRDYEREKTLKKRRKQMCEQSGLRHWILFWQMAQNYADILEQREKI